MLFQTSPLKLKLVIAVAVLVVLGLGLRACGLTARVQNYRLTAIVDVDGKEVRASGVQQLRERKAMSLLGGLDGDSVEVFGEAIPVNLGSRGRFYIIMLDGTRDPTTHEVMLRGAPQMLAELHLMKNGSQPRRWFGSWSIPDGHMPAMVDFAKPTDPMSVRLVDPTHLEKTFGQGVKLKSFLVEPTVSPITKGIEKYLPWTISCGKYVHLDCDSSSYGIHPALYKILFMADFKKD